MTSLAMDGEKGASFLDEVAFYFFISEKTHTFVTS